MRISDWSSDVCSSDLRADMLPAVVCLDYDDRCPDRPTRALLLSELATFLAQIEAHMGKQSLIAPGPTFESDYKVTRGIARTTWLRRDFFEPDYGAHPDRKSTRLNSSH